MSFQVLFHRKSMFLYRVVLGLTVLVSGTSPLLAHNEIRGFGILGDSNSDEYRGSDNRGGDFAAVTLNWVEQLVLSRGINVGPWGNWGEPRRSGYKYNWARSAATIADLIESGQHEGLAQQIQSGEVTHALLYIGTNDFSLINGDYKRIYNGEISDLELQNKVQRFIANYTQAVETLRNAGDVKLILVNLLDPGFLVFSSYTFPDSARRARVSQAIEIINQEIALLAEDPKSCLFDINEYFLEEIKAIDATGYMTIGGYRFNFYGKGNDPINFILDDSYGHPGTAASALFANAMFIDSINHFLQEPLEPLSGEEILQNTGLLPQPSPTIQFFSAEPRIIKPSDEVILRWQADSALKATLDGTGSVPIQGEMRVVPDGATEYTLTAVGPTESATAAVSIVVDEPPQISLVGSEWVSLEYGRPYVDPGAMAHDDRDGDVSDQIRVINPVDPFVLGYYFVVYSVTDSIGNQSDPVSRIVNVVPFRWGDMSGDGVSDATDAELYLYWDAQALSSFPAYPEKPRPDSPYSSDLNHDGVIGALDAGLLLHRATQTVQWPSDPNGDGLGPDLAAPVRPPSATEAVAMDFRALPMADEEGRYSGWTVTASVTNASEVLSLRLCLKYDPEIVQVQDKPSWRVRNEKAMMVAYEPEPGGFILSGALCEPMPPGTSVLMSMIFKDLRESAEQTGVVSVGVDVNLTRINDGIIPLIWNQPPEIRLEYPTAIGEWSVY